MPQCKKSSVRAGGDTGFLHSGEEIELVGNFAKRAVEIEFDSLWVQRRITGNADSQIIPGRSLGGR